jgi:hypothetical protein
MENKSLRVLILILCGMSGTVTASFGRVLEANTALEVLTLSFNCIGDGGANALALGLRHNASLKSLILRACHIGNSGAVALGHALKTNSSLVRVDLPVNEIRFEGFVALSDGLASNTTLLDLDLAFNTPPTRLANRIKLYLHANRFLKLYQSRRPTVAIQPFLWSHIHAQVSGHPAVLYLFVRDNLDLMLAAGL